MPTVPERREPSAPQHIAPRPTAWPAATALGITLVALGLATSVLISVGGAVLFAVALWGWVRELIEEHLVPTEPRRHPQPPPSHPEPE
ncbi:MAG TPA: hypothetical protein VIN09_12745 [Chloroflexota bacterium]